MNIGFDIDGVLTNEEDYLIECMTKYCFEHQLDGMINPRGYETRKYQDMDAMFDIYHKYFIKEYAENGAPRKFASEVIKRLKNDGHNIYIITSRRPSPKDTPEGENMRNTIKSWLNKNEIVYDAIYFETDKVPTIQMLNLDIMVEDSPRTIPIFKDYTHILCFDNRYNADLICNNMTRVYSFYDIYEKISKMVK